MNKVSAFSKVIGLTKTFTFPDHREDFGPAANDAVEQSSTWPEGPDANTGEYSVFIADADTPEYRLAPGANLPALVDYVMDDAAAAQAIGVMEAEIASLFASLDRAELEFPEGDLNEVWVEGSIELLLSELDRMWADDPSVGTHAA